MKNTRYLLFLALFTLLEVRVAAALELYVSVTGNDSNPGTVSSPFATIGKARDAVRVLKNNGLPLGGVAIWLRAGTYDLSASVVFDGRDSGTPDKPIIYSAWPGEQVNVTGGRALQGSWFSLVTPQSPVWSRLDTAARGQLYSIDLRAHGISDFGILKPRGFGLQNSSALEVFLGSRPMTLARWPNREAPLARTGSAPSNTQITYTGSRPERWTQAEELWLDGFWASTWADFHVRTAGINLGAKTIDFANPPGQFGVQGNRPYFAYNLLEEIDQPGEYYIDRGTGILYFWPPAPLQTSLIQVSLLTSALLQLTGTQNIVFRGIFFEISRGPLLEIEGGSDNRFEGCVLRNAGQYAARISGTNNGLEQCEIFDCGDDGVLLSGGVRASLTPGNNYITNCRIERTGRTSLSYHPGINLVNGCGNIAVHNLLGDMPHSAILFTGNNHRIEYNEIRRVCQMTSDAGAIYSGRDWGYRGNRVRFNFIHHIRSAQDGNGVHGVYLDDGMSSAEVFGNVFYSIAGAGIFCGGGRDNLMRNNLIAACEIGHFNGDYARAQYNNTPGSSWNVLERLTADGIQYQQDPWASAFPTLAAIPNSWAVIQTGLWRNPQGCVFSDNAGWSNRNWMIETNFSGTGIFSVYNAIANNNSTQAPLFDETASLDRAQRSPGLQASVSNFMSIPFAAIGPAAPSTPITALPAAPLLVAGSPSSSGVELRWSSGGDPGLSRESGFSVEERNEPQGSWAPVLSFGPRSDFASVSGLAPATLYSFRVKVYNAQGAVYSNPLTIATSAAPWLVGAASRIEAESSYAILNDGGSFGSVGASDALLDSGQSIRLFDIGDAIRINVNVSATGLYRIGVRLRSGDASTPVGTDYWPGGYQFRLDGNDLVLKGDPATLSNLESSFGPTYWGTMYSDAVALSAGNHAVDVTASLNWAAVDYVEIAPLASSQIKAFGDWQKAHFSAAQLANFAVSGPTAAPAGDGVINLFKYALGLDPWTGVVSGNVAEASSVGGKLHLSYLRPTGLADLNYAIEVSNDLVQWSPIMQTSAGLSNGMEMIQGTDPAAVTHQYIRVAVYSGAGAAFSNAFSAGTVPTPPPGAVPPVGAVERIEIENVFTVTHDVGSFGAVASHDGNLDSGGSVSLFDVGDAVSVPFSIAASGNYHLAVRLRAGDAGSVSAFWPNGYQFKLDGVEILFQGDMTTLSALDPSYGPCFWGTMSATTPTLGLGKHTLEIISARAWAVVDFLEISQPSTLRIEAEARFDIVSDGGNNGVILVNDAVLDSGKDVTLFDVGDTIRIPFTIPASGSYRLGVRVRAGDAGRSSAFWPNGYAFKLDGIPLTLTGDSSTISAVDYSYGPTYWGTMLGDVSSLTSGAHNIEVTANRAWAAVDYLEISSLASSATPP